MMTNEELNTIREQLNKITPTPWVRGEFGILSKPLRNNFANDDIHDTPYVASGTYDGDVRMEHDDEQFILHAPEYVLKLLNEIGTLNLVIRDREHQISVYKNEIKKLREVNEL